MSSTFRRIVLYVCLGLAILGFGWVEGRAAEQTAEAVDYGKVVLTGSHAFLGRLEADSLRVVALTRRGAFWADSEAYWKGVAQTALADTLDTTGVAQTPNSPAATTALTYALQACDTRASALDSARALLATDLALCKARGDTLESAVRRLLAVRAPRFGFTIGPAILATPGGTVHAGLALVWGWRF